jgi:hypothetical protein
VNINNHNQNLDSVINNSWQFLPVAQYTLYILERPSSWSISRIRPSRPQSRIELGLLLLSFMSILLVCFGPPSILLSVPTAHVLHSPFPVSWQLNTNVQVNNMAALHHIYTYIYITSILLSMPLFTLLPLSWAGRLVQTLLVCHITSMCLLWWRGEYNSPLLSTTPSYPYLLDGTVRGDMPPPTPPYPPPASLCLCWGEGGEHGQWF